MADAPPPLDQATCEIKIYLESCPHPVTRQPRDVAGQAGDILDGIQWLRIGGRWKLRGVRLETCHGQRLKEGLYCRALPTRADQHVLSTGYGSTTESGHSATSQ